MTAKEKSIIVGLRITKGEELLWSTYCEYQRHQGNDLSLADFIQAAVKEIISPELQPKSISQDVFHLFQEHLQQSDLNRSQDLIRVNFRVPESVVKDWDQYADARFISRTALIRQATHAYLNPEIEWLLKEQDMSNPFWRRMSSVIKDIIQNIITRMRMVKYTDLIPIFEGIDPVILNDWLSQLETEGKINRKGMETYVPAESADFSPMGMALVEELDAMQQEIRRNPEEINAYYHSSLLQKVFGYVETYLKRNQELSKDKLSENLSPELNEIAQDLRAIEKRLAQALNLHWDTN